MPITDTEKASEWVTLTVKVTPELNERVNEYIAKIGEESVSAALRTLIALGLESGLGSEGIVLAAMKANVQALALARVDAIMTSAVELIKSGQAFEDIEF